MPRSAIHGPDVFLKKMKKKPELQKIIDNLHNYTEEDIDKLNQPLWVRKELKRNIQLRAGLASHGVNVEQTLITREDTAKLLADQMERNTVAVSTPSQFDREGDVVQWNGDIWRMPHSFSNSGAGSTIDIEPGDLFLILNANDGTLVYEHRFVKLNSTDFNFFLQRVKFLNIKKTIKEYKLYNIERIEKKHGLQSKDQWTDVPEQYRGPPKHPYEHLIDKNQSRIRSSDFR